MDGAARRNTRQLRGPSAGATGPPPPRQCTGQGRGDGVDYSMQGGQLRDCVRAAGCRGLCQHSGEHYRLWGV